MIRIAICDDDLIFREILRKDLHQLLNRSGQTCQTVEFSDGAELIDSCSSAVDFDLVFLDIEMPILDGRSTAQKIRDANKDWTLIFLTNHEDYAREGYRVNAFRYLVKKHIREELPEAVHAALKKIACRPQPLSFIEKSGAYHLLNREEILYFEMINRKLMIHTDNGSFEMKERVQFHEFAAQFEGLNFHSCYRGIMINLSAVWSLSKDQILLSNGKSIPVSRRQIKELMHILALKRGSQG